MCDEMVGGSNGTDKPPRAEGAAKADKPAAEQELVNKACALFSKLPSGPSRVKVLRSLLDDDTLIDIGLQCLDVFDSEDLRMLLKGLDLSDCRRIFRLPLTQPLLSMAIDCLLAGSWPRNSDSATHLELATLLADQSGLTTTNGLSLLRNFHTNDWVPKKLAGNAALGGEVLDAVVADAVALVQTEVLEAAFERVAEFGYECLGTVALQAKSSSSRLRQFAQLASLELRLRLERTESQTFAKELQDAHKVVLELLKVGGQPEHNLTENLDTLRSLVLDERDRAFAAHTEVCRGLGITNHVDVGLSLKDSRVKAYELAETNLAREAQLLDFAEADKQLRNQIAQGDEKQKAVGFVICARLGVEYTPERDLAADFQSYIDTMQMQIDEFSRMLAEREEALTNLRGQLEGLR